MRKNWNWADGFNILGESTNIINKNKESLLEASMKVDLKVNTENTKRMVVSRHLTVG
jgi:hypothetical protein